MLGFFSSRPNWDFPQPLTPRRVPPPPPLVQGGGAHSLAGEGVGWSQFRRGDRHCGTLGIYVLCEVLYCKINWLKTIVADPWLTNGSIRIQDVQKHTDPTDSDFDSGSGSAALSKQRYEDRVDGQIYQQLISQMSRRFLRLWKNWVACSLGFPQCSCTGRPGIIHPRPFPLFHFLHPKRRSPEVCSTCSLCPYFLCQQQRLPAIRKKCPKLSKFLLLEI